MVLTQFFFESASLEQWEKHLSKLNNKLEATQMQQQMAEEAQMQQQVEEE